MLPHPIATPCTRDDRLRHVADYIVQLFHRQTNGAATVVAALVRRVITARAKCALACTGKDDSADGLVVAGFVESTIEFVAGLATERIHFVSAIDRDPGDAVAHVVDDVVEVHLRHSLWWLLANSRP
jgi:hypothetical protein